AEGVFTLFAVLFVFIGAQFIGLGLLGEYIGRIYHDVRCRPRFFIQEICGVNPSTAEEKSTLSNRNTDHEFGHMTLISGETHESSRACLP
nr:undecaprenyl-phosphate 4-deoxy-4-formamido-L-arabinose transferase [Candidatus Desulfatibia profunda]